MVWDVFNNDCPGSHECVIANSSAAHDYYAGAERDTAPHRCRKQRFGTTFYVCSWFQVVGKHHARPEEYVVFDRHAVENQYLVLDRNAIADHSPSFDERSVTNIAVGSNARTPQDVRECPDSRTGTDIVALAKAVWVHIHSF
ncbi:hypothetical protein CLV47_105125 [Antricoccus suffuscus]|uniref:Uncharacterized protein n=1 Tax=Antricoccus suffuscus TaxID=1629062 RepID=A0A2T1A1N1_9ACTN|nr:hypothetical protein [Antricoccus suffuscus]PRZ42503.1 hypothetical protein CLV47_105125 [Antricoccus suffuscus]